MFATVKPFGGLVTPKFACVIIGYVSAALSMGGSLAAFMRILVASSDSRIIPDYQGSVKVNTMLFLFPCIYCLLRTSTCILLIWGSKIERAQLVLPWIVTAIVDLVLCVVGMVVLGIAAVYFVICVMSYFEDLLKKPNTNFFKGPRWNAVMREWGHKEAAAGATVNTAFEAA
ncbi:uncharacterized protein LOC119442812 isoform X2 [Dermacentor silvarum]|uniref:uncharacterized protein LOC119442812 isoform X2 n=1 Tax=Dermacentor silvarum TaxID=543639 RepID=UPI00189C52C2|nr:uncharacterized protein LOC119442812 isoform X2 [Dermacentor silvarum]